MFVSNCQKRTPRGFLWVKVEAPKKKKKKVAAAQPGWITLIDSSTGVFFVESVVTKNPVDLNVRGVEKHVFLLFIFCLFFLDVPGQ